MLLFNQSCRETRLIEKADFSAPKERAGMQLVWHDEFNTEGVPDTTVWRHERGFVRNHELQWYQPENASCKNGVLLIEGRRTNLPNPQFKEGRTDWRNRKNITFTSSSIQTRGKKDWLFGTFIIRTRIDTTLGAWPAIWTLGVKDPWPSNGEIDIMEFYRHKNEPIILGNFAWGTGKANVAKWDGAKIPLTHFTKNKPNWVKEFHIWQMDWDKTSLKLYLDGALINEADLKETVNPDGKNPFLQPHYLLLNLAIGGDNGGTPRASTSLIRYEVDYVRVYQKTVGLKQK